MKVIYVVSLIRKGYIVQEIGHSVSCPEITQRSYYENMLSHGFKKTDKLLHICEVLQRYTPQKVYQKWFYGEVYENHQIFEYNIPAERCLEIYSEIRGDES